MKHYVYVLAYMCDGIVAFKHAFIEATDDDHAYTLGHRAIPVPDKSGLNDYVVQLPRT